MANIFLGMISRNTIMWPFVMGILQNMQTLGPKGHNLKFYPLVGDSLVSRARNELSARFLLTDCDYFLQIDDDIQVPPDGILKLIEADKDIIGGAYLLKNEQGTCALRAYEPFNINEHPDEIRRLQYLSTGCFLQKRHVIEKMVDAYPELKYIANMEQKDTDRWALYQPYIYEDEYLSEDWAYCQRALDIGLDIYIHTGVLCGHWGLKNYNFTSET